MSSVSTGCAEESFSRPERGADGYERGSPDEGGAQVVSSWLIVTWSRQQMPLPLITAIALTASGEAAVPEDEYAALPEWTAKLSPFASRFAGKKVLVTGGSSGIGLAAALGFRNECADVVIAGSSSAKAQRTADALRSQTPSACPGVAVHAVAGNLANETQALGVVAEVCSTTQQCRQPQLHHTAVQTISRPSIRRDRGAHCGNLFAPPRRSACWAGSTSLSTPRAWRECPASRQASRGCSSFSARLSTRWDSTFTGRALRTRRPPPSTLAPAPATPRRRSPVAARPLHSPRVTSRHTHHRSRARVQMLYSMHAEIKHWIDTGKRGSVVNVGSLCGEHAGVCGTMYTASKFATQGFSKQAAVKYAPRGIRVNVLNPGAASNAGREAAPAAPAAHTPAVSRTPAQA